VTKRYYIAHMKIFLTWKKLDYVSVKKQITNTKIKQKWLTWLKTVKHIF